MDRQIQKSTTETEAKFRIIVPDPDEIITLLESGQRLGPYQLGIVNQLQIQDTYFDTINLNLSKKGAILRTRMTSEQDYVVTLKIKEKTPRVDFTSAIHERIELEDRPTPTHLQQIWHNLNSLVSFGQSFSEFDFYRLGLEGLFRSWGLQEIFSSVNQRANRPIINFAGDQIATLSLDKVLFYNSQKQSRFFEIEIEAEKGFQDSLPDLIKLLNEQYSQFIVPSDKSKYERGLEFVGWIEEFENETKLRVMDDPKPLLDWLYFHGRIADYSLGMSSQYNIEDVYYDSTDFHLQAHSCYLRVRKSGNDKLITFRRYKLNENHQIIDTVQIKGLATAELLVRLTNYLKEIKIITTQALPEFSSFQPLQKALEKLGLYEVLTAKIERQIFPVYEQKDHFANIKIDRVHYTASERRAQYSEIELNARTIQDQTRVHALAYALMTRFTLKPTSRPKYIVGLHMTRTGKSTNWDKNDELVTYARIDIVESLAPWAHTIVKRGDLNDALADSIKDLNIKPSENIDNNIDNLKRSIDLALQRSSNAYNLQIGMALLLFILGLIIIVASLIIGLQGGTFSSASIVGLTTGIFIELMISFPFRQIAKLGFRIEALTTLADGIRLSLEQIKDEPDKKEEYIKLMWTILLGTNLDDAQVQNQEV